MKQLSTRLLIALSVLITVLIGITFTAEAQTVTSFSPSFGCSGTSVTITGTNFTGATAVSFGGTAATSFAVVNATTITAVVGAGATGTVSVTTPGGTATSSLGFTLASSVVSYAYVANYSSNNVSVINTATNTVTATVTVGTAPSGVSVSPDGSKVYVTNYSSNNVSVINTATNTVTATVPVGSGAYGVSVSPDGSKVYVANYSSSNVSVINTATNTISATVPVGTGPAGVSVSPDGSKVYVVNTNDNTVSVINTATNTVIATVPVGSGPFAVSVSPDGSKVYVVNQNSSNVSVINAATNTVSATVTVGTGPTGVSVSPDGSKVYVANVNDNNVSVINAATNTVSATVTAGSAPIGVSVSPDGSKVYVANFNSNNVSVINAVTNTVSATVTVGNTPFSFGNFIGHTVTTSCPPVISSFSPSFGCSGTSVTITGTNFTGATAVSFGGTAATSFAVVNATTITAVVGAGATGTVSVTTPGGTATSSLGFTLASSVVSYAYVANYSSNNVSVINTATNTVTATVTVGTAPSGVSVSPDGSKVYVTNYSSNNVSVINTATNTVTATVPVGSGAYGVSVSPDGSKVYVANYSSSNVSVINTATNTISATVPVGTGPAGVSVSPDGSKVYVVNTNDNTVSVINTATNTVIATVPVGSGPFAVSVSPDGSKVYVVNQNSSNVSVINAATNTVSATVTVGTGPTGVSVSPDGSKVYVANVNDNNVSVINAATNTVSATVTAGSAPIGVSVSPDGSKVYVANFNSNNVSVINAVTNTVSATVTVGNTPFSFGNFIGHTVIAPCPPVTNTWTGTGNWSDGTHWSLGHAPTPAEDAVIATGTPSMDINYTVPLGNTLTMNNGASLVVNPNDTLYITGTAVLNSQLVVFKSDAAGTGSLGYSPGTITGDDNVTVERYLPVANVATGRSWRLLTIPVKSSTKTIRDAWAGHAANGNAPSGEVSGSGTLITGQAYANGNTAAAAGYDWWSAISGAASSIRRYTIAGNSGAWIATPSTTTLLNAAEEGYMLFVRGDRTITTGSGFTTLRPNGSIRTGTQTYTIPAPATAAYKVIGNPYPATISFETLMSHGSNSSLANSDRFWQWDANLGTNGAYRLVTKQGAGNWLRVPAAFSDANPSHAEYISSSQAFILETLAAGNNFLILESDKPAPLLGSPPSVFDISNTGHFYANLNLDNGNNKLALADGVLANFDAANNNSVDKSDASKVGNFNENMSILRNGKLLTLEARKTINNNDTIFFQMQNLQIRNYALQFKSVQMQAGLLAVLQDDYTGKEVNIGTADNDITTYNFTVSSAAGSGAAGRFRVVFKADPSLPLTLTSARACSLNNGVQVDWKTVNEKGIRSYEVEKSINGRIFNKATAVTAENGAANSYGWFDAAPLKGNNYYRIKGIGTGGEVSYSHVLVVNLSGGKSALSIYPNPVKGNKLTLQLSNMEKGKYVMTVYNAGGQRVMSKDITHLGGSATEEIDLGNALASGVYRLSLSNGKGSTLNQILVLQL